MIAIQPFSNHFYPHTRFQSELVLTFLHLVSQGWCRLYFSFPVAQFKSSEETSAISLIYIGVKPAYHMDGFHSHSVLSRYSLAWV